MTALSTAKSGYIQRKIVKVCEDIQIQYDRTVRDATGKIYQFAYGDNNYDTIKTTKVNGKPQPCDIVRLANKLNTSYELGIEEKVIPPVKTVSKIIPKPDKKYDITQQFEKMTLEDEEKDEKEDKEDEKEEGDEEIEEEGEEEGEEEEGDEEGEEEGEEEIEDEDIPQEDNDFSDVEVEFD